MILLLIVLLYYVIFSFCGEYSIKLIYKLEVVQNFEIFERNTLPSAAGSALGKVLNFAECLPLDTRQSRRQRLPPRGNFAEFRWLSASVSDTRQSR